MLLVILINSFAFGAEADNDYKAPPLTLVFHEMGWNALRSFTYNYGLNFIGAGLGTWALIESGVDWRWRNIVYDNTWLSNMGRPGLYIGYTVPGLAPVATYVAGLIAKDAKMQIAGMALTQSFLLTFAIQSPLKMITGRTLPGIVTELDHTRSTRSDNFSNEFNWFGTNFVGGWPSGHTANAFAAAAVISEIYHDILWLKIAVFSYAAFIGMGVTLDVHWVSEALSGALIGYAIGKTIGRSYRKLLENDANQNRLSFYLTPNTIGIAVKL